MKHFMTAAAIALAACACLAPVEGGAAFQGAAETHDLSGIASGDGKWKIYNRGVTAIEDGARKAIRLDERQGDGVILVQGSKFGDGTIELDIRGKDAFQQSFVGIAFHAADERNYDAVYFRPFNFKAPDPVRSNHAVQYIVHPEYPWQKLRAEKPEQYEKPVRPVPDPNDWFHVRVVIAFPKISVYVNGSSEPSLTVEKLGARREGMYGLMVGTGSGGDFANLRVLPAPPAGAEIIP